MTTQNKLGTIGRSQLVRPRFSAGQMLQDDDLTQAVDHARAMNRLMFRSMLGCGVVCGLDVTLHAAEGCDAEIHVGPGLALNGNGDAIEVPEKQVIRLRGTVTDALWVVIEHREFSCSQRELECSRDEDSAETAPSRLVDGFEISLIEDKETPGKVCGCPELLPVQTAEVAEDIRVDFYKDRSSGQCACNCSSDLVLLGVFANVSAATTAARGGTAQLANHSVRRFVAPVLMRDPRFKSQAPGARPQPDQAEQDRSRAAARAAALQAWKAADDKQKVLVNKAKELREALGADPDQEPTLSQLSQMVDAVHQIEKGAEELSDAAAAVMALEPAAAPA